jgi:hypothetical protein
VRLAGLQCIVDIIMPLGHCLGYNLIDWGELCVFIINIYDDLSAMQIVF